jgi:hypothetical protein
MKAIVDGTRHTMTTMRCVGRDKAHKVRAVPHITLETIVRVWSRYKVAANAATAKVILSDSDRIATS